MNTPVLNQAAIEASVSRLAPQLVVPLVVIAISFVALLYFQRHFATRVISLLRYRILWFPVLAPAVIAHETAHALMCVLTLTRLTSFVPFWPHYNSFDNSWTLGHVDHREVGGIRTALISFGPLLLVPPALSAAIYLLMGTLDPGHLWAAAASVGPARTAVAVALIALIGNAAAPSSGDDFRPWAVAALVVLLVAAAAATVYLAGEAVLVSAVGVVALLFTLPALIVGVVYVVARKV